MRFMLPTPAASLPLRMPPKPTREAWPTRLARKNRFSPRLVPRYTPGNSFVPSRLNSPYLLLPCPCRTPAVRLDF